MKRVIVESPYAGNVDLNVRYLRAAMADCLRRNEAPFASHGLYTQPGVLRDDILSERLLGMMAGRSWYQVAHLVVVYTDLGVSRGMEEGLAFARSMGLSVEHRTVPGWRTDPNVT